KQASGCRFNPKDGKVITAHHTSVHFLVERSAVFGVHLYVVVARSSKQTGENNASVSKFLIERIGKHVGPRSPVGTVIRVSRISDCQKVLGIFHGQHSD